MFCPPVPGVKTTYERVMPLYSDKCFPMLLVHAFSYFYILLQNYCPSSRVRILFVAFLIGPPHMFLDPGGPSLLLLYTG